jgi:tetratricopeptide (TPR) repeat protein
MNENELQEALETASKEQSYDQLQELAKQAVTNYPDAAFGYAYLAQALLSEFPTPHAEAELCLAKASQLDPQNTTYLAQFAALKSAQGQEEDAQLMWGKILTIDPNNVDALTARGSFQLRANENYKLAIELFNDALRIELDNSPTYLYRAEAYANLGEYDKALKDIEHALSLEDRFNDQALLLKINVLTQLNQFDAIPALYDEILEQVDSDPAIYNNYAQFLYERQNYAKAATMLERCTELLPEPNSHLLYTLSECYYYTQQYAKAETTIREYIELEPDILQGQLFLMDILLAQENYQAALEAAEALLKQGSDDTNTLDEATIKKAQALIGLGNYDKAEKTLIPIAKKTGLQKMNAYYYLGVVFDRQGHSEKAYAFMKAAIVSGHEEALAYIHANLIPTVLQMQEKALEANKASISKNKRSAFIKKIEGKLWLFKDFKSQKLEDFSADQAARIKAAFSTLSLIVTPIGLALLSEQSEELATYHIKKEAPSGIVLDVLPLDNFPNTALKLQLLANGDLTYSKEKGEVVVLKEVAADSIPTELKVQYQEKLKKEQLLYLGEQAMPVIEALYE